MSLFTFLLISVSVILGVTLILVALLLYARRKLLPGGRVTLTVNGEKSISVEPGDSLLATLAGQGIYLPSACGGTGTCGLCKCRILSGGGSIQSTETVFFTRREQQNQWRLACRVKIKEDMEVQIPAEVLGIKKWECEVVSNRNLTSLIKELVIKLPEGEILNFRPGGYVQIDVPPVSIDFSKDIRIDTPFMDSWKSFGFEGLKMVNKEYGFRAYSMANHPAEGNVIVLNIRIAPPPWDRSRGTYMKVNPGVCSSYVFSLKPGDKVKVSGPYGDFFLKDTPNEKVFIGGGAGMAPMRSIFSTCSKH